MWMEMAQLTILNLSRLQCIDTDWKEMSTSLKHFSILIKIVVGEFAIILCLLYWQYYVWSCTILELLTSSSSLLTLWSFYLFIYWWIYQLTSMPKLSFPDKQEQLSYLKIYQFCISFPECTIESKILKKHNESPMLNWFSCFHFSYLLVDHVSCFRLMNSLQKIWFKIWCLENWEKF